MKATRPHPIDRSRLTRAVTATEIRMLGNRLRLGEPVDAEETDRIAEGCRVVLADPKSGQAVRNFAEVTLRRIEEHRSQSKAP